MKIIGADIISQTIGTTTSFLGYDGHGSTRTLTDALGAVTNTFHFDGYGMNLGWGRDTDVEYNQVNQPATDMLYSGEQYDTPLQMQSLRARYYNQNVGGFNRLDDFAGNVHDPQSLHKYAYCHGDPIGNTDPVGKHITPQELLVVVVIILILVTAFFVGKSYWRDMQDGSRMTAAREISGGAARELFGSHYGEESNQRDTRIERAIEAMNTHWPDNEYVQKCRKDLEDNEFRVFELSYDSNDMKAKALHNKTPELANNAYLRGDLTHPPHGSITLAILIFGEWQHWRDGGGFVSDEEGAAMQLDAVKADMKNIPTASSPSYPDYIFMRDELNHVH